MSGNCERDGIRYSGGEYPLTCPVTCCFVSWLIGCKSTGWETSMQATFREEASLLSLSPSREGH